MTDQTGGSLNAAYEAIKAKDLSRARDLLSAYLVEQPNDVDAWWLYSYAVTDVAQARKALETVLRLDPAYPGARDLLNELEGASPAESTMSADVSPLGAPEAAPLRPLSERQASTTPLTTTITPDDDELSDFGIRASAAEGSSSNRTILGIIAAIILLLILAAVFILPNLNPPGPAVADATNTAAATDTSLGFGLTEETTPGTTGEATDTIDVTDEAPEETPAAGEPTLETTVDAPVEATSEANTEPTADAAADPLQSVYDALGTFEVVPDSAAVETTELGETLTASVCSATSELRSTIPAALTALALSSAQAPAEAQAVGAKFVDCTDNSVLRYVAISMEDAQAYAAGTIDDATLRSRFVPLS
jgi:hypothetical protein